MSDARLRRPQGVAPLDRTPRVDAAAGQGDGATMWNLNEKPEGELFETAVGWTNSPDMHAPEHKSCAFGQRVWKQERGTWSACVSGSIRNSPCGRGGKRGRGLGSRAVRW
jgi:hypothetical protein